MLPVYHGHPQDFALQFDARFADFFENHTVHPTQAIIRSDDKMLEVRLSIVDNHEFRNWLAAFGDLVKVVSPPQ